jgi:hypothetical protein
MDNYIGSWGFVLFTTAILLVMLWGYPATVLLGSLIGRDPGTDRHRLTAAKLVLLECFIVDAVNEMRRERGDTVRVTHEPIITTFQAHGWTLLRAKARQAAVSAVAKLSWVRQVPS